MTASNGFFELQAEDQNKLKQLLENHSSIGTINSENGVLIANLSSELSASEINKFLFDNGISLSHLVKRKPSLEQQFLDLTNNQ